MTSVRWGNCCEGMNHSETEWKLPELYANDVAVLLESEEELDRMISCFRGMANKRMWIMIASRRRILVTERNGDIMEDVNEFEYLGVMMSKGSIWKSGG